MSYREAIGKNKLFGQFENLADFEDVSETEVAQLKGLVLDVADVVKPFMGKIDITFRCGCWRKKRSHWAKATG